MKEIDESVVFVASNEAERGEESRVLAKNLEISAFSGSAVDITSGFIFAMAVL